MSWQVLALRARAQAKAKKLGKELTRTADLFFDSEADASWMAEHLNGKTLRGLPLSVSVDAENKNLVIVSGVPEAAAESELQALFEPEEEESPCAPGQVMVGDVGEVDYESPLEVLAAIEELDDKEFKGAWLSLEAATLDASLDGCKLLVYKLPTGTDWSTVLHHFQAHGTVVHVGPRKITPKTENRPRRGALIGSIRYQRPEVVMEAVQRLNGKNFGKYPILVQPDETAADGRKLSVYGLPDDVDWKDLQQFFSTMGTVLFAGTRTQRRDEALDEAAEKAEAVKAKEREKQLKIDGRNKPRIIAEVEFDTKDTARKAISKCHSATLGKSTIFAQFVPFCEERTRLLVRGSKLEAVAFNDLKNLFGKVGFIESFEVKLVSSGFEKTEKPETTEQPDKPDNDVKNGAPEVETDKVKAKKRKKEEYTEEEWAAWEQAEAEEKPKKKAKKAVEVEQYKEEEFEDPNKRPLFKNEW